MNTEATANTINKMLKDQGLAVVLVIGLIGFVLWQTHSQGEDLRNQTQVNRVAQDKQVSELRKELNTVQQWVQTELLTVLKENVAATHEHTGAIKELTDEIRKPRNDT